MPLPASSGQVPGSSGEISRTRRSASAVLEKANDHRRRRSLLVPKAGPKASPKASPKTSALNPFGLIAVAKAQVRLNVAEKRLDAADQLVAKSHEILRQDRENLNNAWRKKIAAGEAREAAQCALDKARALARAKAWEARFPQPAQPWVCPPPEDPRRTKDPTPKKGPCPPPPPPPKAPHAVKPKGSAALASQARPKPSQAPHVQARPSQAPPKPSQAPSQPMFMPLERKRLRGAYV